ncbi:MAG: ATP-binding cassette domain-containing protein [candidate division KSB1 bacterium]|nr:ATP-binding cassette domain-containing protein [candidate division KSB1 bacterium]MDZ7357228.1 ATP-binding cassette domain-containing protein [candidate division KSB1 bacterium]
MIELVDVSYFYESAEQGSIPALRHITWQFREGEYVAMMGRNNSGKTTLARCLNALLIPQQGTVWVDGLNSQEPQNIIPIRKKVGMVFQNPDNQIVATTVETEIAFGLENLGIPTDRMREIVTAYLERFGLTRYRNYPPHLLSGGEKQRLAIASILAMNPKYLVLDEPSSMLDATGRRELMAILNEIKAENASKPVEDRTAILFITQFPEEALPADRLILLDQGQIVCDGPPKKVFQNVEQIKSLGLEVPVEFEILPWLKAQGLDLEVLNEFL